MLYATKKMVSLKTILSLNSLGRYVLHFLANFYYWAMQNHNYWDISIESTIYI